MQEQYKRLTSPFPWVPPHLRLDRLGLPVPPRKPELRKPLYRLESEGGERYFIHDSTEVLKSVSKRWGMTFPLWELESESGPMPVSLNQVAESYQDVQPGEAVKIGQNSVMADEFFTLAELEVDSAIHGVLCFELPWQRGGCTGSCVLFWDTGEPSKDTRMRKATGE